MSLGMVELLIPEISTILHQGIRPQHWWEAERACGMVRIAATVWVMLLTLRVVLILVAAGDQDSGAPSSDCGTPS